MEFGSSVYVDVQEVFGRLDDIGKQYFIQKNIAYASDDTLVRELINRGFKVVKG